MNAVKNSKELDKLEQLLCFAIVGDISESKVKPIQLRHGKSKKEYFDPSRKMPFADESPCNFYLMDLFDSGRLYSNNQEGLIRKPQQTIGKGCEIMVLDETSMSSKWCKLRRTGKLPKFVSFFEKPDCIYEFHYKVTKINGECSYVKGYIGVNKSGKAITSSLFGKTQNAKEDDLLIVLTAGIIEDAHRSDSVRASIFSESSGLTATTPMPKQSYYEAMSLRDGPVAKSGKKRPILHWVNSFVRKYNGQKVIKVKPHTRGVDFVKIDDMSITLHPQ